MRPGRPLPVADELQRLAERAVITVSKIVSTTLICSPDVVKDGGTCPAECTAVPMTVPGSGPRGSLSWEGWSSCLPQAIPPATATQIKAISPLTVTLPSTAVVPTTTSLPAIDTEAPLVQGPGPVIPTQLPSAASTATTSAGDISSTAPEPTTLFQSTSTTELSSSLTSTLPLVTSSASGPAPAEQHEKSFPQTVTGIAIITVVSFLVLAAVILVLAIFWRRRRQRPEPETPKLDGESIELQHRIPPSLNTLPAAVPEKYLQYIESDQERRERQEEYRQKMIERVRRLKAEGHEEGRTGRFFGS